MRVIQTYETAVIGCVILAQLRRNEASPLQAAVNVSCIPTVVVAQSRPARGPQELIHEEPDNRQRAAAFP